MPIEFPATEVPPPLNVSGIFNFLAISSAAMTSSLSSGITTTAGNTR